MNGNQSTTKTLRRGDQVTIGAETFIVDYAAPSREPDRRGGCCTHDYTTNEPITADGWYVEYHYAGSTDQHRRYFTNANVFSALIIRKVEG